MKHTEYLVPLLALCLALTACGPREQTPEISSDPPGTSASVSDVSQPGPDLSEPDSSASDVSEPEPSLSEEDKAAAEQAAQEHYQGTVFDVEALTEIETRAGEITFQVSCSKGGEKVDPDRTISLERQDGVWTVVSEGY